jgi:hypothetical protein
MTQNGDLVAQHQRLGEHRGLAPSDLGQPTEHPNRTAIASQTRCACSSVSQWTTTSLQYRSKRTAGNARAIHASNA